MTSGMAQGVGLGGIAGERPYSAPRRSRQQDFLDYMYHHNREAWHRFMTRYRGMDFRQLPMPELEGRFRDEVRHVQEELTFTGNMMKEPQPSKKKTWFEEIQAEVNEWLAGVNK